MSLLVALSSLVAPSSGLPLFWLPPSLRVALSLLVALARRFEHNGVFLHFTMMLNYLKSQVLSDRFPLATDLPLATDSFTTKFCPSPVQTELAGDGRGTAAPHLIRRAVGRNGVQKLTLFLCGLSQYKTTSGRDDPDVRRHRRVGG